MTHQKPNQNTTNQGETQEIGGEAVTCGSCTEIGKSEGQAGGGTKGGAPACGSDPCGDGRVLCQLPKSHAGQHSETDDGRTFTWNNPPPVASTLPAYAPQREPDPPGTIRVAGCDDCPCAVGVGQGFTVCQLYPVVMGHDRPPNPSTQNRPAWCPIAAGPVALRVRR